MLKETVISDRTAAELAFPVQQASGPGVGNVVLKIVACYTTHQIVTLDDHLKCDLDFDSLILLELCDEIETTFHVLIADKLGAIETVRDIVTLVERSGTDSHHHRSPINDYPLQKTKFHIWLLKLFMQLSRFVWHFDVSGVENIPPEGPYILCANHQSCFDSLWIWASMGQSRVDLNKVCSFATEGSLSSRFILTMLSAIPIDRNINTLAAMRRGFSCIQEGYTMLVYPEGERTRDGRMHEFKRGAAKLAIEAQVPIVPVRIDGAWDIFPPHQKRPKVFRWGARYILKISFRKPITPDGKEVNELTSQTQAEIAQLKG